MTKRYLQDWYSSNNINHIEKGGLDRIGIGNYDYHYLQDLKQILRCENWAKNSSEIRNNITGRIRKIIFFTPNFNDSKPDASNYSCAIVVDGNSNNWVIIYRPSYIDGMGSDIVVKKTDINIIDVERKLNGSYPVSAISPDETKASFLGKIIRWPYLYEKSLPSDAKYNPDKYILPLDIVKRPMSSEFDHYAIYLGNKQVAHFPDWGKSTQFDSWEEFHSPSGRNFFKKNNSSSGTITLYHPQIPFKRKEEIVRHIAKAVSCEYGRNSYDAKTNNCEHIVRRCVLGLDFSPQTLPYTALPENPLEVVFPIVPFIKTAKAWNNIVDQSALEERIIRESNKLDDLTSSYSYEKNRIEQYIREAKNNHSYTRSRYQIEQEKFQERIEVYPKDWCRIS